MKLKMAFMFSGLLLSGMVVKAQWTTSGSDIYYNSGNVGIGSSGTPPTTLHVTGTLESTGNTTLGPVNYQYPYRSVFTWDSDHTGYYMGIGYQKSDASNKKLHMWWIDNVLETNVNAVLNVGTPGHVFDGTAPNSGRTIGARIQASGDSYFAGGNVGIGTSSPVRLLDINYGSTNTLKGIAVSETDASGTTGLTANNTSTSGNSGVLLNINNNNMALIEASNAKTLRLTTINTAGTGWNQGLVMVNSGNVGIGTASPAEPLDIVGNARVSKDDGYLILNRSATSKYLGVSHRTNSVAKWFVGLRENLTSDNYIIYNEANGTDVMTLDVSSSNAWFAGNVGIGTTTPSEKLSVNGNIVAKKVKVTQTGWPDYVFKDTYALSPLTEVEAYIKKHGHLQGIPAAAVVEKEGQDLGEMNRLLLEKVEELTLYVIQQEKKIESMNKEIERLIRK